MKLVCIAAYAIFAKQRAQSKQLYVQSLLDYNSKEQ
jgi:hypothetical protein